MSSGGNLKKKGMKRKGIKKSIWSAVPRAPFENCESDVKNFDLIFNKSEMKKVAKTLKTLLNFL